MNIENQMDQIFKEVCNLKGDTIIEDNMSPDTVETWDSLANIHLITKLEERFNIEFEFDELLDIENWGNFKDVVKYKLN